MFVDGQASQVGQLMLWSAGCYTATALFFSFKSGLQVCKLGTSPRQTFRLHACTTPAAGTVHEKPGSMQLGETRPIVMSSLSALLV